jgi:hypothetical protein
MQVRIQRIGYAFCMKAKTHPAFNIDVWDAHDSNIVDHLAGLDDFLMAVAAYDLAVYRGRRSLCARARGS